MRDPGWLINVLVIAATAYLSFVMTLAGWLSGLRKGEAVTLLPLPGTLSRSLWLNLAFVGLSLVAAIALIYFLWIPIPFSLRPQIEALCEGIGLFLFAAGVLLVLWARKALGRMWGISSSRKVKLLPDHQLINAGPYSVTRHPMYAGWLTAVLGLLLVYRTWILLFLFALNVPAFVGRARLEEKTLAARFGEEWRSYVAQTGAFLPPVTLGASRPRRR